MRKYTPAIKSLRAKIKTLATEGQTIRQQIHSLKWKDTPEAQEALGTLRAAKAAGGRQTIGKRLLKPYRRPETGSERYGLWNAKRGTGYDARHHILAMGLLKGRPYLSMETQYHDRNAPSCGYILDIIHETLGENEELKAEWTQEKIVDLILVEPQKEAA